MTALLTIADLGADGLAEILRLSERADLGTPLAGKGVALVFQKSSARTRNSMEMAVVQLGGHPVYIQKDEVGLGSRETAEDIARTLACYHEVIAARVMDHRDLDRMAASVAKPLINLLSDLHHPLQALADLLTIRQLLGRIEGARIAYVGDANNVARSLAEACSLSGAELVRKRIGQDSAALQLDRAQALQVARHGRLSDGKSRRLELRGRFLLARHGTAADEVGKNPKPARTAVGHDSSQASAPRALCIRFSACFQTADRGPSITSAATSSPRRAGRQWRNRASAPAAIRDSSTW